MLKQQIIIIALIDSILIMSGLFFSFDSLAANQPSPHSTDIKPRPPQNTVPYRTSFVLFGQHFREVPIYSGDRPNPGNCMRSFTIPYACPVGYKTTISGSLAGGGVTDGRTFPNMQGFGLKYLLITSSNGSSRIDYCGYTFYGKNKGNANKAWLSYTAYCHGQGAGF